MWTHLLRNVKLVVTPRGYYVLFSHREMSQDNMLNKISFQNNTFANCSTLCLTLSKSRTYFFKKIISFCRNITAFSRRTDTVSGETILAYLFHFCRYYQFGSTLIKGKIFSFRSKLLPKIYSVCGTCGRATSSTETNGKSQKLFALRKLWKRWSCAYDILGFKMSLWAKLHSHSTRS